jgi:lipopolysaccharide transport system ATP-binding protein
MWCDGMGELTVRVERVGKEYRLGGPRERYSTLRERINTLASAPFRALRGRGERSEQRPPFWALKDVSFEVRPGEVVGIIGRNGAGKSTLLKILSRITEPTEGEVDIDGRVGSLLEVGTGFHPELSGRENVYLNGAILGMRRAEIARKFDEIVAFAEVENFIDTPVKHYSSGMYMRLAFAVAAHLEPEILIVDEVLAVGDTQFQKKCLGKMGEVARGGRTVLFVSHNTGAIRSLCKRICLLRQGRLVFDGPADQGLAAYAGADQEKQADRWSRPAGAGPLSFTQISARLEGDQPCLYLILDLRLRGTDTHSPAFLAVDLRDEIEVTLMQALPAGFLDADRIDHNIRVKVALPPLIPGRYWASLWVGPHNTETYDAVESAVCFEITTSPIPGRTFPHSPTHGWVVPHSWMEMCDT